MVGDVPCNCTVVGVPGHIIVRDGKRVELERVDAETRRENLPDPMAEEIASLRFDIDRLLEHVHLDIA